MTTTIFNLTILAAILLTASCKKDDLLSKGDRDVLFAPPSATELSAIYTDWEARDLTPTDYTVIQESNIQSGKYTLRIVSFKVNNIKEYGMVIVPTTTAAVPVQMFITGFGLDIINYGINLQFNTASTGNTNILAIPALRGQALTLTLDGTTYTTPISEGNHCDAFDGATDDVLAFLNLIAQTEQNADVNRTAVRGGSRGGGVALLAGIRDTRIKRVVDVAGPTNMLELTFNNEKDLTYQCQFLDAYKSGNISLAAARNKMIASSPIYFAEHLPLVQLHMGLRDDIVPISQAYELQNEMKAIGKDADFQLYTYDRTHQNIATGNNDLSQRIEDFFSHL